MRFCSELKLASTQQRFVDFFADAYHLISISLTLAYPFWTQPIRSVKVGRSSVLLISKVDYFADVLQLNRGCALAIEERTAYALIRRGFF